MKCHRGYGYGSIEKKEKLLVYQIVDEGKKEIDLEIKGITKNEIVTDSVEKSFQLGKNSALDLEVNKNKVFKEYNIIEIVSKGQVKRIGIQNPELFEEVAENLGWIKRKEGIDIGIEFACSVLEGWDIYVVGTPDNNRLSDMIRFKLNQMKGKRIRRIKRKSDYIKKEDIQLDVEKVRRIIINKELVPTVCEDSRQAEWTVGESRKLAQAICNEAKEIVK